RVGLSATVPDPNELARWLVGNRPSPVAGESGSLAKQARRMTGETQQAEMVPAARTLSQAEKDVSIIFGAPGARPGGDGMTVDGHVPWAGHMGKHAMEDVYRAIKRAGTTLVFVNTRAQAEFTFQELWRINEDSLPIALHHGSLDVEQRRRVEAAMTR